VETVDRGRIGGVACGDVAGGLADASDDLRAGVTSPDSQRVAEGRERRGIMGSPLSFFHMR